MLRESSVLVALVDRTPAPPAPAQSRGRGRPPVYPDRLFLKAVVVMVLRRLPRVHSLLAVLDEPTVRLSRCSIGKDGRLESNRWVAADRAQSPTRAAAFSRKSDPDRM